MPTVTVAEQEFHYNEIRTGTRRIKIWTEGRPPQCYKFDPDPHSDAWYNNLKQNNQAKFYKLAALALGQLYIDADKKFPRYGAAKIMIKNTEYTLDDGTPCP